MKKAGIIFCTLMILITQFNSVVRAEDRDTDKDGVITYVDSTEAERTRFMQGYSSQGSSFEFMHVANNPLVVNIGLPSLGNRNERNSRSYRTQSSRIKRYYNQLRYDTDIYPRNTRQWYGTVSWYDAELDDYVAYVNCTYPHTKLTTPETIYYDGHRCQVIGISLTNCYVKELVITDNIKVINKIQCPKLKNIVGGLNVERINEGAFYNDIYLVNFPYFPSLEYIGPYAFEGCLNLTNVLLPPLVKTLYASSFGWYDVVLGNMDYLNTSEDGQVSEYEGLKDNYRIFGITLYASKGSDSYNSLEDIFGGKDVGELCNHISYEESKKYPGRAGGIVIDDNEEVEEWLPPIIDPSTIDWGEDFVDVDHTDPIQIENSLTDKQKTSTDYICYLLATEQIDLDMAVTLMGSLAGLNVVPKDFLDKHSEEKECIDLVTTSLERLQIRMKKMEEVSFADKALEWTLSAQGEHDRMNMMYYLLNDFSNLDFVLGKINRGNKSVGSAAFILQVLDNINRLLDYVNNGDSWETAFMKAGITSGYLLIASAIAPAPLQIYEMMVYVTLGNSKGSDALSLITTGRHVLEAMSDAVMGVFYESWEESANFAEDKRWSAFYTLSYINAKEYFRNLTDTNKYKYGQNVTNMMFVIQSFMTPGFWGEVWDGYKDLWERDRLLCSYLDDVYDVTVVDNRFGAWIYDFIESYYSKPESKLITYLGAYER